MIPLEIQGCKNVHEFIKYFIQNDQFTGQNQYSIGDGKIDARKFDRIELASLILVLQLKRFIYDMSNWERVKVNDRYEFPKQLNIREAMIDSRDECYELKGGVLHSEVRKHVITCH
jgi:ubiquitin carboxyl-terminal hydrolase 7